MALVANPAIFEVRVKPPQPPKQPICGTPVQEKVRKVPALIGPRLELPISRRDGHASRAFVLKSEFRIGSTVSHAILNSRPEAQLLRNQVLEQQTMSNIS